MVDQADMTAGAAGCGLPRRGRRDPRRISRRRCARRSSATTPPRCSALAGELHEADTGDLIEALDAELRPRFVELMGREFDFTALTEVDDAVREEILEELPSKTVAEGVRDLDSDDAAYILEDLPKQEQAEILEQLPPPERVALERILDYPEDSAGRRMQTEFIAVPPSWTVGHAIDYMRETADLPDRFFELYVVDDGAQAARRGRARPAAAHQAAGADRRSDGPRPPPGARHRGPGGGGAHVRALQPGRGAGGGRRRAAGRRAHLRRHRRRHRGGGRGGHQGARRRQPRRRAVGLGLDHRQEPLPLAARQSRHRVAGVLGASASSKARSRRWWRSRC